MMFSSSTKEVDMPNLLFADVDFYGANNIEKLNLPKVRHIGGFNFTMLFDKEYTLPSLEEVASWNFE